MKDTTSTRIEAEQAEEMRMTVSLKTSSFPEGGDSDEEFGYRTAEERKEYIDAFVFHHAERIAELAGVDHLYQVEDIESYVDVYDHEED